MENLVPRECFFNCETVVFSSENGSLYYEDATIEETMRLIIFADGKFFDLKTGDEIINIENDDGLITGEIYANTMYVQNIYNYDEELTDELYNRGQEVYQMYLLKKRLIEERKLVLFQQKRLY